MMNKKKLLAILMAILVFSTFLLPATSTVAHAAEELEPGEVVVVPTRMWNSVTVSLGSGAVYNTSSFTADGNYMAFQMTGTGSSSAIYSVSLLKSSAIVTSSQAYANGGSTKVDWIPISSGSSYSFRIVNNSSTTITVTLTYYSWS